MPYSVFEQFRSKEFRKNASIAATGFEVGFMFAFLVLVRVAIVGAVFGVGYLANEHLMPILPHGFVPKWYEVIGVLVLATVGIILMRTSVYDELKGGGDGIVASIFGVAAVLTFLYFTQDRPTPLAWEILTMSIAGLTAFLLGTLGEWLAAKIPY